MRSTIAKAGMNKTNRPLENGGSGDPFLRNVGVADRLVTMQQTRAHKSYNIPFCSMISMFGAKNGELNPVSIWLTRRCNWVLVSSTFLTSTCSELHHHLSSQPSLQQVLVSIHRLHTVLHGERDVREGPLRGLRPTGEHLQRCRLRRVQLQHVRRGRHLRGHSWRHS